MHRIKIVNFLTELVNCGGHSAVSCEACPEGHGKWWCNGECIWKNKQCIHPHCKIVYIYYSNNYFSPSFRLTLTTIQPFITLIAPKALLVHCYSQDDLPTQENPTIKTSIPSKFQERSFIFWGVYRRNFQIYMEDPVA